jgi:hypothetical protein
MELIVNGLRNTWQLKKLIAILWITNLLMASLFLIPYSEAFRDFFSNRLVTDVLAKQNLYTYYAEFYHNMNSAVDFSLSWIQLGNLVYYLLMALLTGGFISALLMKERREFKAYWRDCIAYGTRMILLALFSPVLLGILFLIGIFAGLPFSFLLSEVFVEDQYFYYMVLLAVFIFIFVLGGWLFLDIVKIRIIEGKNKGIGHTLVEVFRLLTMNPVRFYSHYLAVFLIWIIFMAMYWFLQHRLSDHSTVGIFFEFLLLQVIIWGQIWIRFSRYDILIQLMQSFNNNFR